MERSKLKSELKPHARASLSLAAPTHTRTSKRSSDRRRGLLATFVAANCGRPYATALTVPKKDMEMPGRWLPAQHVSFGCVTSSFEPLASADGKGDAGGSLVVDGATASGRTNGVAVAPHEQVSEEAQGRGRGERGVINPHQVALEVGDEVYVFEVFKPDDADDPLWYRGYAVSTSPRPRLPTSIPLDQQAFPSTTPASPGLSLTEEPQVSVGIFPASHVQIRDSIDSSEHSESTQRIAADAACASANGGGAPRPPTHRDLMAGRMEPLQEENEDEATDEIGNIVVTSTREQSRQKNRASVISISSFVGSLATELQTSFKQSRSLQSPDGFLGRMFDPRPAPPLPNLKCGDETASGLEEPLIDEIACALREWASLLYTHLYRRDYALFDSVKQHIEVLHSGRKQLLAKGLSRTETDKLRRELVSRLVQGNVEQGLDVIVRHPQYGGFVDVGVEGDIERKAWVSVVKMCKDVFGPQRRVLRSLTYALASVDAMQVALAYSGADTKSATASVLPPTAPALSDEPSSSPITSSASRFAEPNLFQMTPDQTQAAAPAVPPKPLAKFHHVFVDVRSFNASPCLPGELVELYFALFNKTDSRYITEEWCVILNHLGQHFNDAESKQGRMRTLFLDLSQSDVQDQLFLVCRIVKNASNKNAHGSPELSSTSTLGGSLRRPSFFPTPGSPQSTTTDDASTIPGFSMSATDLSLAEHGGMLLSDASGRQTSRRPFGCAVLEISQFAKASETSAEHSMPIFVPVHESNFSLLHEDIIASRIKEIERNPCAESLSVNVRILYGEANALRKSMPQLLDGVPLTNRLGFPDVVFPGDQRNEIYLKIWNGTFSSVSGMSGTTRGLAQLTAVAGGGAKNIEVTAEVRTRDGRAVERAISRGTGGPNVTQFQSITYKSNNSPTWAELLKLEIPVELMESCHVFFTVRSRGSKERGPPGATTTERPFAFGYMPLLLNNSAFQSDGSHVLTMYKYDVNAAIPSVYLKAPSLRTADSKEALEALPAYTNKTLVLVKDTLTVRSFLVSTTYTQNETLLKLLRWETELMQDSEALKDTLTKLRFCSEVEVCKFLRPIFDALFGILARHPTGDVDDLVFHALVTILGFVSDRRFHNFRPVLNVYIDQHFSNSSASSHIISSLHKLLRDPSSPEAGTTLRASIKVWHYLFKFVVTSREIQRAKDVGSGVTSDHLEMTFKRDLSALLTQINFLMRMSTPSSIIGTQTLAVQHFASIIPDLAKCFDPQELANLAISFCDSITPKGKIAIWKILLQSQLVNGVLFTTSVGRAALVPNLVRWLKSALGKFDEHAMCSPKDTEAMRDNARVAWVEGIRLANGVVAAMLDSIHTALVSPEVQASRGQLAQEQDNIEYLLALAPKLLESYRELENIANLESIARQRSTASVIAAVPTVFPSSYPFSLIALPPNHLHREKARQRTKARSHVPDAQSDEDEGTPVSLQGGVGEVACVFIAILHLAPCKIFTNWLESISEVESKDKFGQMLAQIFRVSKSILSDDGTSAAFPSEWLSISILAHQVIVKILDPIADILERDFIPASSASYTFNTSLWRDFFSMLLRLLGSPQLLIEDFSPQKRRAVWRLAGDLRGEGAKVLGRLWNAIGGPEPRSTARTGGYQVQFVPGLVGDVLTLCLSHHDELRKTAVQVLFSMIVSEYSLNDDFRAIEAEVIDRLDKLFMSQTKNHEISRAFFVSQLKTLFDEAKIETKLREQVETFIASVNSFLDLLLAVRNLPDGEEYQEDRIISTLKLMSFIRGIGRSEIFVRYVDRLVSYHIALGNETEAGLTLMLHADLHTWDLKTYVDALPDLGFPRQTAFARKESLYMRILEHMTKGKAWETALALCKELQQQYETHNFNYARLSELLILQSELYASIIKGDRQFGDFFRVAFYGNRFPSSVSGKQFIYRAPPNERLEMFTERMLNKHPNATLLKSSMIPPDDVQYSDGQLLQITAATPEPDATTPMLTNPDVPPSIKAYYQQNETHMFSFSRPFVREGGDKPSAESEFMNEWVEKTVLICEDSFPTVLRRSEVVEIRIIEISPIEMAIADVESQRQGLNELQQQYTTLGLQDASYESVSLERINTQALSLALNAAVDPPPQQGVPMYRRAFFGVEYAVMNPGKTSLIQKLQEEIDQLVLVIGRCLKLHAVLCFPDMGPFHATLENLYAKTFANELSRLPEETFDATEFAILESDGAAPNPMISSRFPTRANGGSSSRITGGSNAQPVLRTQGSVLVSAGKDPTLARADVATPTSSPGGLSRFNSVSTLTPLKRRESTSTTVAAGVHGSPSYAGYSMTSGTSSLQRSGSMLSIATTATTTTTHPGPNASRTTLDSLQARRPSSPATFSISSTSTATKRKPSLAGDVLSKQTLANLAAPFHGKNGGGSKTKENGGRNSVFGNLWKRKGSTLPTGQESSDQF
ncbi:BZ3500_MvSof-1268-A1-R1_Chr1-1g00923 [Microbotryum saponariae]|uniref:BZ3500_MvSof-1268-A1-R1_Chr1-1g00923 protein n=1 Tax=Microbotryum saponariae TaxID=289078 RepID=A0A2X0MD03_9BASI|nr:BZ3500_MvSof-1268-A1-R1_Chr1-1g00923 [Microbotryum saponariae]SCZ92947.1 BZ3501_MvSof-1269-A2-R1_Chr1-1g00520 [Microbotryum saponariae]